MSTRKSSNTTKTIANVVKQARLKYEELMESEYISVRVRIDGKETRGQAKDNESIYNLQDKNSKLMTCTLDIDVNRGSYVEMQEDSYDEEYKNKGDKLVAEYTGDDAGKLKKAAAGDIALFEVVGMTPAMGGYEDAMIEVRIIPAITTKKEA